MTKRCEEKADKARDDFNTSYQCRLFILDTHALSNQMAEQNGLKILRAILSYLAHYYTQTYTQQERERLILQNDQ